MIDWHQIKKTLLDAGLAQIPDLESVEKKSKARGVAPEEVIVSDGILQDEQFGQIMANLYGIPFVNLHKEIVAQPLLEIVPEVVARSQKVFIFGKDANGIKVAMADPKNLEMAEFLERKTGEEVHVYFATPSGFESAFDHYLKPLNEVFAALLKNASEKVLKGTSDEELVQAVDTLMQYGYQNRASDIHIEPLADKTAVRFRIDGILYDIAEIPKALHPYLIRRLKVLASLRIDEHETPQDGRIRRTFNHEAVDIRISILPIFYGEKAVLRLLAERARRFSLSDIGFSEDHLELLRRQIDKPYGMILATGPSGSGKTTTLYGILKILNTPEVNIATIEDPIEYDIERVNQIQANPKTGLTFAEGLKSIVRQDPDVIMVGEIRDHETADLAVNAAMTGHLVLSTLHTNNSATTVTRLEEMGIEPFLIASTVNIAIAQRLVRKICSHCIFSYAPTAPEKKQFKKKPLHLYKGKGCEACHQSGYSGRIGIFEILEMNDAVRDLIMKKSNASEIEAQAVKSGMKSILEDGLEKVALGLTTLEELMRVTR